MKQQKWWHQLNVNYDSIIVNIKLIKIIDFSAALWRRLWDFHFMYEYIMKISYSRVIEEFSRG